MLLMSKILILLSSAVTFRRDKAISFNRIAMIVLLYSSCLGYETLFLLSLQSGIGIYGSLLHVSSLTQTFVGFISISMLTLMLTLLFITMFKYSALQLILQLSLLQVVNKWYYLLLWKKVIFFMTLIAIITSVISASYYLGIIKVFFLIIHAQNLTNPYVDNYLNKNYNMCLTISIITLMLLLFITISN